VNEKPDRIADERARYREKAKAKSTTDPGAVFLVDIDQE
jgi:hypothetical protein